MVKCDWAQSPNSNRSIHYNTKYEKIQFYLFDCRTLSARFDFLTLISHKHQSCVIKIGQTQWLKRYISMEVELIFKIAAVGILVAVLNILLSRSGRDEQALMVTLAGLVCVLVIVVREISDLFSLIKDLFSL